MNPTPFVILLAAAVGGWLYGGAHYAAVFSFAWLCFLVVFNVVAGMSR